MERAGLHAARRRQMDQGKTWWLNGRSGSERSLLESLLFASRKNFARDGTVATYASKRLARMATSALFGASRDLPFTRRPPGPRQFGRRDLSVFPQVPPVPALSRWTIELIFDMVSDGSPGPDGITGEDIYLLGDDSLQALIELLNKADAGHLPAHWQEGRVAMIPKADAPGERRPLTVMNISYRLWAKRSALHYNAWLHSWAPRGLVGARTGGLLQTPHRRWPIS